MALLVPWFWKHREMPAREVMRLTPRQADAHIDDVVAQLVAAQQEARRNAV